MTFINPLENLPEDTVKAIHIVMRQGIKTVDDAIYYLHVAGNELLILSEELKRQAHFQKMMRNIDTHFKEERTKGRFAFYFCHICGSKFKNREKEPAICPNCKTDVSE